MNIISTNKIVPGHGQARTSEHGSDPHAQFQVRRWLETDLFPVDEWLWVDVRAYNTLPVHQRGTTGGCTGFPVLAGELSDKELCTHRPNQFGEQWISKARRCRS